MGDKRLVLILGGARSGKSLFAEDLAARAGGQVTYIATSAAGDDEMVRRVAAHRDRRPPEWKTVEEALSIPEIIAHLGQQPGVLLIDCLTGWLSNMLLDDNLPSHGSSDSQKEDYIKSRVEKLASAAYKSKATVLVVSNEVGQGLVPPYPLGRLFRDISGNANRHLASVADEVYLVVAGLSLEIKSRAVNVSCYRL